MALLTGSFSVMGHVAKADGRVSPDEIRMAEQLMNQMQLSPDMRAAAKKLFGEGKAAAGLVHYQAAFAGIGNAALHEIKWLAEGKFDDILVPLFRKTVKVFIVAFGVALVTFAGFDRNFAMVGGFVTNLVTFNLAPIGEGTAGLLLAASVVLLALLVAYIPTTHMSHFIAKYFAYHSIRWDDEPNLLPELDLHGLPPDRALRRLASELRTCRARGDRAVPPAPACRPARPHSTQTAPA